jgi:hypothetical protein
LKSKLNNLEIFQKEEYHMTENACTRCGKPRIAVKTWNETIGTSVVTYTQTVCPDPECQKAVETQLQGRKDKLASLQKAALERKEQRLKQTNAKHGGKAKKKSH